MLTETDWQNASKEKGDIHSHPRINCKQGMALHHQPTGIECNDNKRSPVSTHGILPKPPDDAGICGKNTKLCPLASPMVHPTTGKTITSYKRLMNNPKTAKIWQTVFGKDFGGMAQGDDKTDQKDTNSIFVMTHEEIATAKKEGKTWTYARIVIDYRPQKEDLNQAQITVGGNLIKYKGDVSPRTADLITSKLLWNSVLSTEGAQYIKNFYLTAGLDCFKYMKMSLLVFPAWIKKQYNLDKHALNGFVYLRMECPV
jgi:hypothetical protein